MPRLFVGLTIPPDIQQYLLFAQGGVTHARWQTSEQLHLTLRFIGDVDGRTASDIETALDTISFAPFDVYAEGVGLFGKLDRARSVWARVKPKAALTALHNKIDQALSNGAGLAPETRQYEPHITLARFSGRHGPLHSFMESAGALRTPSWQVDHFSLFLSTLGSAGAHYSVLGNFGGLDNPWAVDDFEYDEPQPGLTLAP